MICRAESFSERESFSIVFLCGYLQTFIIGVYGEAFRLGRWAECVCLNVVRMDEKWKEFKLLVFYPRIEMVVLIWTVVQSSSFQQLKVQLTSSNLDPPICYLTQLCADNAGVRRKESIARIPCDMKFWVVISCSTYIVCAECQMSNGWVQI